MGGGVRPVLVILAWESAGNSTWYIFVILVLYIATYFSFRFTENKNISVILEVVLSIVAMVVISFYKTNGVWFNTILCYTGGMMFAHFKERLDKIINTHWFLFIVLDVLIVVFVRAVNSLNSNFHTRYYIYNISTMFFAFFFVLLQYKFEFKNKVLDFLGKNLFGIYIIQRLPMIYLRNLIENYYLYNIVCIILGLSLGILLNKLLKMIDSKIIKVN